MRRAGVLRRRALLACTAVVGAMVLLALLGSRTEPPPPFEVSVAEDGTAVLTGRDGAADLYRLAVPEGLEAGVADGMVQLAPTAAAPVRWAVTIRVLDADGPLSAIADAEDLRERLPGYGDGRTLHRDPTPIALDGVAAQTWDVRDDDGEPYISRAVAADRDGRRILLALAVPEADVQPWLDDLEAIVLGSWEWVDG